MALENVKQAASNADLPRHMHATISTVEKPGVSKGESRSMHGAPKCSIASHITHHTSASDLNLTPMPHY